MRRLEARVARCMWMGRPAGAKTVLSYATRLFSTMRWADEPREGGEVFLLGRSLFWVFSTLRVLVLPPCPRDRVRRRNLLD